MLRVKFYANMKVVSLPILPDRGGGRFGVNIRFVHPRQRLSASSVNLLVSKSTGEVAKMRETAVDQTEGSLVQVMDLF